MFTTMVQAYYQASKCVAVSAGDIVIVRNTNGLFYVFERVGRTESFWDSIAEVGRVVCYISTRVREFDCELLGLGKDSGEIAHG